MRRDQFGVVGGSRQPRVNINMREHSHRVANDLVPITPEVRVRMEEQMVRMAASISTAALSARDLAPAMSRFAEVLRESNMARVPVRSDDPEHRHSFQLAPDADGVLSEWLKVEPSARPAIEEVPSPTKDAEENKSMGRMITIYRDQIAALEDRARSQAADIRDLKMILFKNGWGLAARAVDGAASEALIVDETLILNIMAEVALLRLVILMAGVFLGGMVLGFLVCLIIYPQHPRGHGHRPQRDIDWVGTARRDRHGHQPSVPAGMISPNQRSGGKPPPSRDD